MYSIPLFYIFFCVLAISSIWIIVMRWKRYMKYSNGTYKNAGQNLIFKTELSQNEIIRKLETHDAKDTLDYDFYEKNGEYFLKVKGVKRLVFNGILTADFKVDFLEMHKDILLFIRVTIFKCYIHQDMRQKYLSLW